MGTLCENAQKVNNNILIRHPSSFLTPKSLTLHATGLISTERRNGDPSDIRRAGGIYKIRPQLIEEGLWDTLYDKWSDKIYFINYLILYIDWP